MNAHANISYEDRLKARYAAARSRIFGAGIRPKANDNKQPRIIMRLPDPVVTLEEMPETIGKRRFIRLRAKHYGINPDDIFGYDKHRRISYFRQLIMLETREQFPEATWQDLGRAFNHRDHTTILHGVARAKEAREQGRMPPPAKRSAPKLHVVPKPSKRSVRKMDRIKRPTPEMEEQIIILWRDHGLSYAEICRQLNVGDRAPKRVLQRRGITR